MRVLFFGRLRDVAATSELDVAESFELLSELRRWLAERHDGLDEALSRPGVRVAIDQSIIHGDAPLRSAKEVAFMPPMSGG